MNVLVFDIETIPDLDGGRRIYDLDGLSDKDTASALLNLRRQENGTEFLRLHLHRIVAISVVLRSAQGVKVWSLGDENSTEKRDVREICLRPEATIRDAKEWIALIFGLEPACVLIPAPGEGRTKVGGSTEIRRYKVNQCRLLKDAASVSAAGASARLCGGVSSNGGGGAGAPAYSTIVGTV